MSERTIQQQYVMEFLCRREEEGGLGYRKTEPNIVTNDLFIPSVLGEFVKSSDPNLWNRLIRNYNGDEQKMLIALKDKVKEQLIDAQNVATFINKHRSITFDGETVPLYYASGSELRGDEDFKKNIFCAVEESGHEIKNGDKILDRIRPDITFFLNGIYIGYLELKTISMGQSAEKQGREKIAHDYLQAIKVLTEKENTDPNIIKQRKQLMAIYEKAIHLVATDINKTFVLRGVSSFFDMAHQEFSKDIPSPIDAVSPAIIKVFKQYPENNATLDQETRFEETARALYSKKMIEKEILYYNFIEYHYSNKDGEKGRTSNTGKLIAPRPKQKFGCDKIMARITEMLEHEKEPNYYANKLRKQLEALGVPRDKQEEIIRKRESYNNNKYVYSLLMQYAAGFGKSNIIGWTALQLKDFRYEGAYAYDKIMLVVDRLQLRDQLDTTMMNMNIDKSMFIEATDKPTFIDALNSTRRIIVVNIQKFLDLQQAISESGTRLEQMRVAFLIDEIHRSNSGENHDEMINLFAKLQESFTTSGRTILKKNLLIGFTATPSDETLTRFGEFRSATTVPLWVPFDSYTMKEAIDDGFILDPTKHIIPYSVPVGFELPADLDEDQEDPVIIKQNKQKVYEYEPRMLKIADFVVDRLLSLVYGKIRGEGKAMLAVSSIPIAIKYCHIIRKKIAERCLEPQYARFKDAPVALVYSDNQKYDSSASMNYGMTEKQVIQNFKTAKNGLIIVVDKLQTGFDEPKLHTLFLDKEINDINAIQTISRVNRTCKYKTECHVIDCSWQNVNIQSINIAFRKYCGIVISDYNPEEEAKEVARLYKLLVASEPYSQWYARYQQDGDDANFILEMEDGIRNWILQCYNSEAASRRHNEEHNLKPGDATYVQEKNDARDLRLHVGQYASSLRGLSDVYEIDPKYSVPSFLSFWQIYCAIFRDATKKPKGDSYAFEVVDVDELPGITMIEDDGDGDDDTSKRSKRRAGEAQPERPKGKSMEQVLEILKALNAREQLTAQMAQLWLKEIGIMFKYLKEDEELLAFLKDDFFDKEQKLKEYQRKLSKYRRTVLRNRTDIVNLELFLKMLKDNEEQLFAIFMKELMDDPNSDFNYDVTSGGEEEPKSDTSFDYEAMKKKIKELFRPEYNETALKEMIVKKKEQFYSSISRYYSPLSIVVDYMFTILKKDVSVENLKRLSDISDALNVIYRAKELSAYDKKANLIVLLIKFEVYLKKIFFLIHGDVLQNFDGDGEATLKNAKKAFSALRGLKYNPKQEYQFLYSELNILTNLRNQEAHGALDINEAQLDTAIDVVTDMYVYITAAELDAISSALRRMQQQELDDIHILQAAEEIPEPKD